jgi:hypothetical protein
MAFIYNLSDTWNDGATTFTGIGLNVTDTASAAASNLLNLQVGGVSIASVRKSGLAIFGPTATFTNNIGIATPALNVGDGASVASNFAGGQVNIWTGNVNSASLNSGGVALRSTSTVAWGSGTSVTSADLFVARDAANTLAQRNGVNAQAFRVYNTFTDASNYERVALKAETTYFRIITEKAGTGAARALAFATDGLNRWEINTGGHFLAAADNTYDIGASGANRPRNIWLGSGVITADSGTVAFGNRAAISATNTNIVRISNAAINSGATLEMAEMTAPAAPAANGVRIYAEDNGSGKTRLMALFATGAAVQIAIEP